MKKSILTVALGLLACGVFAYNPPAGGQNLQRLSSPWLLTGANSTAGGPIFELTPAAIVTNPALAAWEQRITIDAGFTLFLDDNTAPGLGDIGSAFQVGLLLPSRWGTATFLVDGVFAPLYDMNLANNILFTANFAKDINDKVSVGIGVTGGGFWDDNSSDWQLAANTGVYYDYGDLLFMKDLRFAVTLMNLGKMYSDTEALGIKGTYAKKWPGIATPRAGVAAVVFDKEDFSIGGSVDFATPAFQDIVLDLGVSLQYAGLPFGVIKLNSAWEYDFREWTEGSRNPIPAVGISFSFNKNAKSGSALANHGWDSSEITPAFAWRNLYEDINAFSGGVVVKLGGKDNEPPVITLWNEE